MGEQREESRIGPLSLYRMRGSTTSLVEDGIVGGGGGVTDLSPFSAEGGTSSKSSFVCTPVFAGDRKRGKRRRKNKKKNHPRGWDRSEEEEEDDRRLLLLSLFVVTLVQARHRRNSGQSHRLSRPQHVSPFTGEHAIAVPSRRSDRNAVCPSNIRSIPYSISSSRVMMFSCRCSVSINTQRSTTIESTSPQLFLLCATNNKSIRCSLWKQIP